MGSDTTVTWSGDVVPKRTCGRRRARGLTGGGAYRQARCVKTDVLPYGLKCIWRSPFPPCRMVHVDMDICLLAECARSSDKNGVVVTAVPVARKIVHVLFRLLQDVGE